MMKINARVNKELYQALYVKESDLRVMEGDIVTERKIDNGLFCNIDIPSSSTGIMILCEFQGEVIGLEEYNMRV
jgi:hypothetical protein